MPACHGVARPATDAISKAGEAIHFHPEFGVGTIF